MNKHTQCTSSCLCVCTHHIQSTTQTRHPLTNPTVYTVYTKTCRNIHTCTLKHTGMHAHMHASIHSYIRTYVRTPTHTHTLPTWHMKHKTEYKMMMATTTAVSSHHRQRYNVSLTLPSSSRALQVLCPNAVCIPHCFLLCYCSLRP